MLSIETRINGHLLGFAYIKNELGLDKDLEKGIYNYSVEYHRPGNNPEVIRFDVMHKRDEGAEKLSLLIYEKLNRLLKRKKVKP